MAVEGFKRGLQLRRETQRIKRVALAASFLRHFFTDVFPQIAEHRHFLAGDVVGNGNARQFDDAALNRVHERKIAHRPRKQSAFDIARTAQEKRRGGQINHAGDAKFAVHRFKPGNPHPRRLRVFLGFFFLVTFQLGQFLRCIGFLAVAMMRLVIQHHDVFQAHQIWHHALKHLAFGFECVQFLAASLQKRTPAFGEVNAFAQFEGVKIRDENFCAKNIVQHIGGNKFAAGVITVGVVGLENAQAFLDGQAGGDDEKTAREFLALRATHRVDGLPRDEHCHDGRFARAGRELQREPHEFGVGVVVGVFQMVKNRLAGLADVRRNFGQPDGGFDRLDLTEKRADSGKFVTAPMLQEPGGFRRHLPTARIGEGTP